MPNNVAGSGKIMAFIAKEISETTYINVMDQYRPCGTAEKDENIDRRLTADEYRTAVSVAREAGLTRLDSRVRPRLMYMFRDL
jgi:putative pyruvate formate lyase activating enzyme